MDSRVISLALSLIILASPSWARFSGMVGMWGGVATSSTPVQIASDDFSSYTHGTQLSATANWTTVLNGFVTLGADSVRGTQASYNAAYWDANTFNANQYSEAILGASYGSGIILGGCSVRVGLSGSSKAQFYGLHTNGATTKLYSYNGDDTGSEYNEIASYSQAIPVGSGVRLEVSGTGSSIRLAAYYGNDSSGWTAFATGVDPTDEFDSGSAGLSYFYNTEVLKITYWEGGNL